MPLYKLKSEMPYDELLGWNEYFSMRPVGWREDLRTSYLLSAQGIKEKAESIFPSIAQLKRGEAKANPKSVANSSFFHMLKTAASKNGVEWLPD